MLMNVFKKMEEQGLDPVLFGLTDNDYQLIAKNFAQIRNQLKITNDILDKYKEYYGPKVEVKDIMFFEILTQFGLPVAAAVTMGGFIYIILKYILGGVVGSVKGLHGIIMGLENRIDTMNNDLIHIDTLISSALHLKPDLDRIARSDGKNDARKD